LGAANKGAAAVMAESAAAVMGFACPGEGGGCCAMAAVTRIVAGADDVGSMGVRGVAVVSGRRKMTVLTGASLADGMACGTAFETAVGIMTEGAAQGMWF